MLLSSHMTTYLVYHLHLPVSYENILFWETWSSNTTFPFMSLKHEKRQSKTQETNLIYDYIEKIETACE